MAAACFAHTGVPGVAKCPDCGRQMCRACFELAKLPWRVCGDCTPAREDRRRASLVTDREALVPGGVGHHQQVAKLDIVGSLQIETESERRRALPFGPFQVAVLLVLILGFIGQIAIPFILIGPAIIGGLTGFAVGFTAGTCVELDPNAARNLARWRFYAVSGGIAAYLATFWFGYMFGDSLDLNSFLSQKASAPLAITGLRSGRITSGGGIQAEGMHYGLWLIQCLVAWYASRRGFNWGFWH